MPIYPDEIAHVVIRYRPTTGSEWGGEEALTTFWLRHDHHTGNTFSWHDNLVYLSHHIATKLNDHWADIGRYLHHHGQIVGVKVVQVASNGHTTDQWESSADPLPLVGLASGDMMPPEVALAISQWAYEPGTFTTHKGRKRGRFYLPYLPVSLSDGEGKVQDSAMPAISDNWRDFLSDINGMHAYEAAEFDVDPDTFQLVTVSGVDATTNQVHYVSVDDHFDSQRRRQHQDRPNRYISPAF